MREIVDRVLLQNIEGRHNKFYEITLTFDSDNDPNEQYVLTSRYGKRKDNWRLTGGTQTELGRNKVRGDLKRKMNDTQRSKIAKGYTKCKTTLKEKAAVEKSKKKPTMKEVSLSRFANLDI